MTGNPSDDLEPRLTDHLRQRASRVGTPPDVADVHHRIADRHRKRTRALGAALAMALVAGPVLGFALARGTEPDVDTVTAGGGGGSGSSGTSPVDVSEGGSPAPYADLGSQLAHVSARTTDAGIRLVVHASELGQANGPCVPDGVVRVGVVDGDLIDVVIMETAPGGASFLIAGTVHHRPMWVVVVRGFENVEATFPNGAIDHADATEGLAVLAAYGDAGPSADAMVDDVVALGGTPMVDMGSTREARHADGYAGCPQTPTDVAEPPLTMPEPGEPPADEDAARAAIEELFSAYGGQDPDIQQAKQERPNVWRDANARFQEEHPDYVEWAKEVYGVVHEIVFTAPDRASVRRSLVSDDPSIPAPGERVAEAVLIDGVWKISIETACSDLALAGIECDFSIEG